jgi:DNA repair exonuclease SbcCD ATPase subunit
VGENGSGKSTFIEAISFALYGKPFRKINKPQLVNAINNKNTVAEIEFSIGNKNYLVRRGLKPALFEIYLDDTMLNQEAASKDYQEILEKNILRLTHKSFSQIITLGSSTFIPFMQLPAQARREFIEDLLDIQIFSTMNILLKNRIQTNKDSLQECTSNIALCQQKIELSKKHIDSLKQNNDEMIEVKQSLINEQHLLIGEAQEKIAALNTQITELLVNTAEQEKITKKLKKVVLISNELQYKLGDINKHIEFFDNHDNCPTCTQQIDSTFKSSTLTLSKNKVDEINTALDQLLKEQNELSEKLDIITGINTKIAGLHAEITDNNNTIRSCTKYIETVQKEIEVLQNQTKQIDADTSELNTAKAELKTLEKEQEALTSTRTLLGTAATLLKDGGIKTKIIKQYIPIMNKLINKYLAAMDFFVQFELDENFDEKIKSRFRDEFTYASFSEGEKMRIDLSLLFTWRAVSKLRNSASTNLLIMDEVFDSSLDASGTEEFFKILGGITADTNVFIISHKGASLIDKFSNVIRFVKQKNFSVLINEHSFTPV